MKKYLYLTVGILLAGGWLWFAKWSMDIKSDEKRWEELRNTEDQEEQAAKLRSRLDNAGNERIFSGLILGFITAGLVGTIGVAEILPRLAQKMTHAVYDSGEEVETDPLHDARSKVAQGDWEGAIEAFKLAAAANPENRLPWVEISKIQRDHLEDPAAAAQTMRDALVSQAWQENDAAYLLFRLAEIEDADLNDRASAVAAMKQVIEQFPETRHSANARHKLREWGEA